MDSEIDHATGGKIHNKNPDESWEIIENLALYNHEGWNDAKEFVKQVKAISTPQPTSKTPNRRLLELEDQINFLLKGSRLLPRPSSTYVPQAYTKAVYLNPRNQNEPPKEIPFTFRKRTSPDPQSQALGTTFEARVQDYMAAHTERMERFENTIFKQREEINDRMAEMFRLLKELMTSRTPEKVLIREAAKFPVTKNVNSISIARGEEERNDDNNVETGDDIEKPTRTEMGMLVKEAEEENEAENGIINEPITKAGKEETTEAPSSQFIEYYLKHRHCSRYCSKVLLLFESTAHYAQSTARCESTAVMFEGTASFIREGKIIMARIWRFIEEVIMKKIEYCLFDVVVEFHRGSLLFKFKPSTVPLEGNDYVIGDSVISRVYYVEGLGHNLFSVGQFCDSDLEVAFRKHSCYVRDTDGVELLKGSRGSNLYTISVEDMMKSSPICLLSKASKNKSWLWHRRLNHLNFGTINDLARKDLARGLPRLKFEKDHLCSACQLGKSKKHTHKPKTENTNLEVLNTLHMDLCGPMRVQTINGKKYILVIVDDYSRFTWVKFLRSKDETPAVVIKFLTQIQVGLNKTVRFIRTDNGTEFVNKTLYDHYEKVGIFHQKTVPRTPQQNGVVERRNRTLVEAARTMLIFSKAPMFLWAEAVATACYTQNRSLIHTRHEKTPYELVHDKKPDITFFRVFGALCYPTNDSEDLGKLQPTADIGIFVGYAPNRKGYRIYNKRTRQIMETIHVTFDELTEQMAPVQFSSGPAPILLTPGPISSGLVPNPAPAIPFAPPTNKDLEMLFHHVSIADIKSVCCSVPEPFVMLVRPSDNLSIHHLGKSTYLNPANPLNIMNILAGLRMQDEIHEFDRLEYMGISTPPALVPMIICSQVDLKSEVDEYGDVLKNKALVVAKGFRQEGKVLNFEESFAPVLLVLKRSGYSFGNAASKT
ncbi:retrovirus-related pol polyprotein from transposon TNT 1-94 [Tanacetum coccineum]